MIHYVEGDIVLSNAQAIAHGVEANSHFNQGLALTLRERWPGMYKDFRHWSNVQHPKPGEVWTWSGPGRRIVCMLTQEGTYEQGGKHGRATIANVNHCLRALRKEIEQEGIESLALPRLATGVGGLDWADVKPLIEQHLADVKIPVYVYETFKQGEAAKEPGLAAT